MGGLLHMAFVLALTSPFHYQTPLSAAQVTFFSRFDVLVTHDPLPRAQVDALHAHGTKLLVYEWSVAFYGARDGVAARAAGAAAGRAAESRGAARRRRRGGCRRHWHLQR